MVPRVHPDKSVSVFCLNCNDTAARLHRSLLRTADRRSLVIFGVRWWGAPLVSVDEFGPVVFLDYLRSMSVVKTLKTTAFYELTKVISQVRRAERLRNAANSKIYRRILFRIRHICFLLVTESLRTETYYVTNVCFFFFFLLFFSFLYFFFFCPVAQGSIAPPGGASRTAVETSPVQVTTQKHVNDIKTDFLSFPKTHQCPCLLITAEILTKIHYNN